MNDLKPMLLRKKKTADNSVGCFKDFIRKSSEKVFKKTFAEHGRLEDEEAAKRAWSNPELLYKKVVDDLKTITEWQAPKKVFEEVSVPPKTKGSNVTENTRRRKKSTPNHQEN